MDLPTAPEWAGVLALGMLVSAFALLTWWLFVSPIVDCLATIAIVLPVGCLAAISCARMGVWLRQLGDPPTAAVANRAPVRRTAYP